MKEESNRIETVLEEKIWDALAYSYLSWVLVFVLVVQHILVSGTDWIWGASPKALLDAGALNATLIDAGEIWRFSISLIIHGDLLHLSFNALALLALGRIAESIFGRIRCLAILYLSGLAGAFLSWSMGAERTVGASGAIFGLLAALSVCGWKYRNELRGELGGILRRKLLFWGVFNLLIGLLIPNIDNPSHFGGFLCGGLLGALVHHRWEGKWDGVILSSLSILGIFCSIMSL
jgi:rhomboid protease GluP